MSGKGWKVAVTVAGLLAHVLACQSSSNEGDDEAPLVDAGLDANLPDGAPSDAQAIPGEAAYPDAAARDAAASDAEEAPCPSGLSCGDPLAALKPLGLVDDAGAEYWVCGGQGKDPIFGLSDVFQPPKCKSKADCTALGLNVACSTFRNFGERCTRSCSH